MPILYFLHLLKVDTKKWLTMELVASGFLLTPKFCFLEQHHVFSSGSNNLISETVGEPQQQGGKRKTAKISEADQPAYKKGKSIKDAEYRERKKEKYLKLEEENNALKSENQELKREIEQLKSENVTLGSQLKITDLERQNEVLKLENQLLNVKNEKKDIERDLEIAIQNQMAQPEQHPIYNQMAQSGQPHFYHQLAQPGQLLPHNQLALPAQPFNDGLVPQQESESRISGSPPKLGQRLFPNIVQPEEAFSKTNSSSTMLPLSSEPRLEQSAYCKELFQFEEISEISPSFFCQMYNLKIVKLSGCRKLKELPVSIGLLKKLTYVDICDCSLLDQMPKQLASLSELRVLKGFVISDHVKSCSLDDLTALKKLEKLSISIIHKYDFREQLSTAIPKFENLKKLQIAWGGAKLTAGAEEEESEELSSRKKPTDDEKKQKKIAEKRRENRTKDSDAAQSTVANQYKQKEIKEDRRNKSDAVQSTINMGKAENEIKPVKERSTKIAGAEKGDGSKDNTKPWGIKHFKKSMSTLLHFASTATNSWL
ncbi:hypothetical protein SLEP1_g58138 [Rubroshorea leprosula]|uniref:BZIP domain-containing protein n=1 Tax=Rubroshorea leprosula TaxID=152421 RepID=A0AAV5MNC4_9ROSI|nr:hypothetical protein SLEP1_g58138 [Rubroshorea leprosula]